MVGDRGTAPAPAMLGTALVRGVNYVPDSEEEEAVDDGSTASPPAMLGTALVCEVDYVPNILAISRNSFSNEVGGRLCARFFFSSRAV